MWEEQALLCVSILYNAAAYRVLSCSYPYELYVKIIDGTNVACILGARGLLNLTSTDFHDPDK